MNKQKNKILIGTPEYRELVKPQLSLDEQLRIFLFHNDRGACDRHIEKWKNQGKVMIQRCLDYYSRPPEIDEEFKNRLLEFHPSLIVTELDYFTFTYKRDLSYTDKRGSLIKRILFGKYNLTEGLGTISGMKDVPIIFISKYINSSKSGEKAYEYVLKQRGAVAAFPTIPDIPNLSEIIKYAKPYELVEGKYQIRKI